MRDIAKAIVIMVNVTFPAGLASFLSQPCFGARLHRKQKLIFQKCLKDNLQTKNKIKIKTLFNIVSFKKVPFRLMMLFVPPV